MRRACHFVGRVLKEVTQIDAVNQHNEGIADQTKISFDETHKEHVANAVRQGRAIPSFCIRT